MGDAKWGEMTGKKWLARFPFWFFRAATIVLLLLWLAPLVFSQNCALCYTQAASAGSRMIEALRSGILILVVPPTLMSIGVVFVAYSKRNQFRKGEPPESLDDPSEADFIL